MERCVNQDVILLTHFSEIISKVESEDVFSQIVNFLGSKLKKVNLKDIHPLILNSLINNICAKILLLNQSTPISPLIFEFIDFLLIMKIIPPVYQSTFMKLKSDYSQNFNFQTQTSQNEKTDFSNSDLFFQLNSNISRLLNIEFKIEKISNKNFGYAIVDLNGEFVWCDPNCEKYFEIKAKQLAGKNFFDMMIPFSKQYLIKKHGSSIFSGLNSIGSSMTFSYVIYSKNSMNKFFKCLKKIGVSTQEEFKMRLKRKDSEDAVYHQYLKALSTRASMILVKTTPEEYKELLAVKDYSINQTKSFDEITLSPLNLIQERLNQNNYEGEKLASSQNEGFFNEGDESMKNYSFCESKIIVRQLVLLEARLAANVPMFDYRQMNDDPKIKAFEQKILKKITNKDNE